MPGPRTNKHQHAMPGFQVSDHDAAGQRLEFIAAMLPVVKTEHRGPHPSEHLAGEDLFQHAAEQRPLHPRGRGIGHHVPMVVGRIRRETLQASGPAIKAAFRCGPILLYTMAGKLRRAADEHRPLGGKNGGQFDEFSSVHGS